MNLAFVIPAHNEAQLIGSCIHSIHENCRLFGIQPEIIVVLNRCTDQTKEIVEGLGATVVYDDSRNLAKIRNTGIQNTQGDVIVTIDADSILTKEFLSDLIKNIESRKFIGGGTKVDFTRKSLGIAATKLILDFFVKLSGLSCGAFWFYRQHFDEIGGFNENLHFGEDMDFAKRLRDFGKSKNLQYGISGKIMTSARKFDQYGDWYFFKLILFKQKTINDSVTGKDLTFVNEYFYDFNTEKDKQTKS